MSKSRGLVLDSRLYHGNTTPPVAVLLEDQTRFVNSSSADSNVTWSQIPLGLWAKTFQTAGGYIFLTADESLSIYRHGRMSFEQWIRADSDGENDGGRIFEKINARIGLWVESEIAAGCLVRAFIDHVTVDASAITSTRLTVGTWHHVVMVYNRLGTARIEIYIDGVLATLGTDTAGTGGLVDDRADGLWIGNVTAGNRTFDGYQERHRIYNYALLAEQVASNFEDKRHWIGA